MKKSFCSGSAQTRKRKKWIVYAKQYEKATRLCGKIYNKRVDFRL